MRIACCVKSLIGGRSKAMAHPAPYEALRTPPIPLYADVQRIVADIFGIPADAVARHADLVKDLGATSLESIEIIMAIEDAFGIEISDSDASRVATVDDLERLIRSRKAVTGSTQPPE